MLRGGSASPSVQVSIPAVQVSILYQTASTTLLDEAASVSIKAGDFVASDDNEATLTVERIEGDLALCAWFVDGDVDGERQEAWLPLATLTLL